MRYKVWCRDASDRHHSETKSRRVDAERRKAEIELEMSEGIARDPRRGDLLLREWVQDWLPTRDFTGEKVKS